jgi:hypothetical protein
MRVQGARQATALIAVGLMLTGCAGEDPQGEAAATPYAGIEELPERLGEDGTTITVGDAAAPMTIRVYEDPRCPVVDEFETTGGTSVLRDMTVGRRVKTEYTFASFRDDRQGGDGSKRAVNALRTS